MKYFYKNMELEVPEGVYYPMEDSELLAKVLDGANLKGKKTLEIGCGSGFLSILMVKKGAIVSAVDINPIAVETTKANARKNSAELDCFFSDMFDNVTKKYDLVVFNPPYLPVSDEDIEDITYSGGSSGREIIEGFLGNAVTYLNPKGKLLLVISSLTDEAEVLSLVKEAGFEAEIKAREKIDWEELIVIEAGF